MPHKADLLKQYGKASLRLVEFLKDTKPLSLEEQAFVENHLLIVQLAFTESKYRACSKATTHTDAA